jgi:hypothetical protein
MEEPKKLDGRRLNGGPRPKVREDDRRGGAGVPGAKDERTGRGMIDNNAHVPTPESREQVFTLIQTLTQPVLAKKMGISVSTLQRHYARELELGIAEVASEIGSMLIGKAKSGNLTAQIFFLKTRGGWSIKHAIEHTGAGGGPIQTLDLSKYSDDELRILLPLLEQLGGAAVAVEHDGESGAGGGESGQG